MYQPEISVPDGMAEFGYHDLDEMSVPAGMREFGYHDLALNLTRFDILRWNAPKTCSHPVCGLAGDWIGLDVCLRSSFGMFLPPP